MIFQTCIDPSDIIPITGMDKNMTILIFGVIIPMILSILTSMISSRLVAPLFLKAKNGALAKSYKDGYIVRDKEAKSKSQFLKRLIFVFLLTLGIYATLESLFNIEDWTSDEQICRYLGMGITSINFSFELFMVIFGLSFPIAVGLMSIAWILEDSDIVHYSFKKGNYYEIEPIYVKYYTYIKGYAGISSLVFVSKFFYNIYLETGYVTDGLQILVEVIVAFGMFIPVYFIYSKLVKDKPFLRKGLSEIKILSEEDLK